MTTNRANETVEHVSKALDRAANGGDQVNALERLQQDIRKDMQGMTLGQVKEYMPQLTKELEDKNQLPVLALAFAEQLGGDLNDGDLRSEMRSANRAVRDGDNTRELDKVLLKYLSDNYDKGAELIEADNDKWFRDDSNISKTDISTKLAEFRKERDDQKQVRANQETARNVGEELMAGDDKSLFNFIDRTYGDGRLTKYELQKYVSDAESSGSTNGQYAPEKQELVKKILEDWDAPAGRWMRGEYADDGMVTGSLTKLGLAHAAGESSEAFLLAARKERDVEDAKPVKATDSDGKQTDSPREIAASKEVESDDDSEGASDYQREGNSETERAPEETSVQQVAYEVRKGDSYWRIASGLLGDDASPREILEKTKELQELNGNQPLLWMPGNPQKIKIPPVKLETSRANPQPRPAPGTMLV